MFYSDREKKKTEDLINDPKSKMIPATYELWAILYDEVGKIGNMVQVLAETVLKHLEQQSRFDSLDDHQSSEQKSKESSTD